MTEGNACVRAVAARVRKHVTVGFVNGERSTLMRRGFAACADKHTCHRHQSSLFGVPMLACLQGSRLEPSTGARLEPSA